MFKKLFALILCGTLSLPCYAQEVVAAQASNTPPNSSSVKGLTLPDDQTVRYDEGFINIKADCKGDVSWLVLSQFKIKYIVIESSKTIIVSIPPDVPKEGGIINIFAVGVVDGKLTGFVRTNIYVSRTTPPGPIPPGPLPPVPPIPPPPNPDPVVNGKLHLTFLVDVNSKTTEIMKLVNSESLRKGINENQCWFRFYDIKSDIVKTKNLTETINKVGGNAVLVIQDESARVISAVVIPRTEQEVFDLIKKIRGK